jgi:transposase
MKTAVNRIGTGNARQINARFAAITSHCLFEPEFCNPASGWEKGQVEKNVQDARRRPWQPMPSFPDNRYPERVARGAVHSAMGAYPMCRNEGRNHRERMAPRPHAIA